MEIGSGSLVHIIFSLKSPFFFSHFFFKENEDVGYFLYYGEGGLGTIGEAKIII